MKQSTIVVFIAGVLLADTVNYKYDDAGRLISAIYGNGTTVTYTYDKAGNLLSRFVGTPGALSVVSASPASGNAAGPQSFTFQFSDPAGYQKLDVVDVLINNFLDGRHACYLAYSVTASTLFLVDDAGEAGGPFAGSVALGSRGTTIQNSQCAVNLTSATGSGTTLTLTVAIAFKAGLAGNRIQYLSARDTSGGNTDWQAMGVWQAPPPPAGQIAVGGFTPARASALSGTAQTLTVMVSDTKGTGDLGVVNVLVNNFIDGRQSCYLAYGVAANTLYLVDDLGDAGGPFAGGMVLNGAATGIQNGQCSVSATGSSMAASGNILTLTLNVTFKAGFTGNRIVWVASRDSKDGNNTDWQAVGTSTVK